MKLAFATLGCPDWDLEKIARNAKAMGYDGVELRVHEDGNHFDSRKTGEYKALRALFDNHGTRVFTMMMYSVFAKNDPAALKAAQEELMRCVDLAAALGAPFIRSFVGRITPGEDRKVALDRAATHLRPCIKKAASEGIEICLETHDDWCEGANLRALADAIGEKKGLGVVWDISNAYWGNNKKPVEKTFEDLKPFIRYCHVKDAVAEGDKGGHRYVPVGTGQVPLKEALKCVKTLGRDIWLSFEHEKKWIPTLPAPEEAFPMYVKNMRKMLG
jgi:sugar phosphate isomerase/epimerase